MPIHFSMTVHPNPGSNNISVDWLVQGMENKDIVLTISDPSGRVLQNYRLLGAGGTQKLDTRGLSPGIYTLTARCENRKLKTDKLILK